MGAMSDAQGIRFRAETLDALRRAGHYAARRFLFRFARHAADIMRGH